MPARGGDWPPPVDRHAPRSALRPAERIRASAVTYEADQIELACVFCVLELDAGEWSHERSCPAARRTA